MEKGSVCRGLLRHTYTDTLPGKRAHWREENSHGSEFELYSDYASVGGATRHTVVHLCIRLCVCVCVCVCVILSAPRNLLRLKLSADTVLFCFVLYCNVYDMLLVICVVHIEASVPWCFIIIIIKICRSPSYTIVYLELLV